MFAKAPANQLKKNINDCTILVIGENHGQKQAISLIQSISEYLREMIDDPIAYAYEMPSSNDKASCEIALKVTAQAKLTIYKDYLIKIEDYKSTLVTAYKDLSQPDNSKDQIILLEKLINILELQIKDYETIAENSYKEAMDLLLQAKFIERFDDLKIAFKSIDMEDDMLGLAELSSEERKKLITSEDSINSRDAYMTRQIMSLLPDNKIVIVHVGKLHLKSIIDKLIENGVSKENIVGCIVGASDIFEKDLQLIDIYKKRLEEGSMTKEEYDRKVYRLAPYVEEAAEKTALITLAKINNDASPKVYADVAKDLVDHAPTAKRSNTLSLK